jgi:hypothetical protein
MPLGEHEVASLFIDRFFTEITADVGPQPEAFRNQVALVKKTLILEEIDESADAPDWLIGVEPLVEMIGTGHCCPAALREILPTSPGAVTDLPVGVRQKPANRIKKHGLAGVVGAS